MHLLFEIYGLDQPAFRWTHLNADKLIYFKDLEHLICIR